MGNAFGSRIISAVMVGFPVCIGLAAQGYCIMEVHLDPSRIPDGRRSLSALFDGSIMAQGDGTAIHCIRRTGSYTHGNVIDGICISIRTDGDGPDIRHACGTNVVAGSGFRPDGDAFPSRGFCLMADGNGAFTIISIVPGVGLITQNNTILHMDGRFGANGNGISGPIVIIPCRINRLPDGDTSVVDGVAVQPQGQGILFHRIAIADGDAVIPVSAHRIFPTDFVVAAQSQGIGPVTVLVSPNTAL